MKFGMKILVVGGGGREHALVWKLAKDSLKPVIFLETRVLKVADHLPETRS